ncbi:hypothetical protein ACUXNS_000073 [Brevibacterium pityocampae]
MLRAQRINSEEPPRVRFPQVRTVNEQERADLRAYLATTAGQDFVDDCRNSTTRITDVKHRHGTLTGYSNDGCRCGPCTDAYRAYRQARRAKKQSKPKETS